MEQKRVSFEVARALKEVGYPQNNTDLCYLTADHNQFYKKGQIVNNVENEWAVLTKNLADIPTYVDVWFWLWREKKIHIDIDNDVYGEGGEGAISFEDNTFKEFEGKDPEEAIITAIDYLVTNNLLNCEKSNS